jgi:hypothetical protein
MINHGRTLLLNRNGAARPAPTFYLEEFVPEDFVPRTLSSSLNTVYQMLIGDQADDAFANYRVWQYMKIMHSTEFASLLTDLDSRITYLNNRTLIDAPTIRSAEPSNGLAAGLTAYIDGQVNVSSASPRLDYRWEIEATAPTFVNVTDLNSRILQNTEVIFTEGLSSPILMPGQTGISVRIQASSLPVGAKWIVLLRADPPQDLANIIAPLDQLGEEVLRGVFGVGNVEPYKTLNQLWKKHYYFHYRLSGLIIAYIYRVEELRLSGG